MAHLEFGKFSLDWDGSRNWVLAVRRAEK